MIFLGKQLNKSWIPPLMGKNPRLPKE